MKISRLFFLSFSLIVLSYCANAQTADVLASCGSLTVDVGGRRVLTMDSTGKSCVNAAQPTGTTTQAKVTIAVTNTYIQALASNANRKGCTIQYIAVVGTKGFVFFGSAPGDTTTSFQLTSGQSINCAAAGVTLTDAVQVTATATDIFVIANQ